MLKENQDIRDLAKQNGIRLWQIAEYLYMTDSDFSKLMRHELPENTKREIINFINEEVEYRKKIREIK